MERRFGPLLFIRGKNSGKYPHCHSLFVEAGARVVIDPASDEERLRRLRTDPGVDCVWLSHWHEDHFTHLNVFEGIDVWIPAADAGPFESLDTFFDAYGMDPEERDMWVQPMNDAFHFRPRQFQRLIDPGEIVDLGGLTVEVVHTPGHTPGHCSLFFREIELLFLGDYDLTPFGPWYGDVNSDIDAVIESVRRLREIPAATWIASHETGIFETDPGDLWDKYLDVIDQRDQKVMDFLVRPRTMTDVVEARIVYGKKREPKEFFDFGERAIMGKHIQRLMKKGLVTFDGFAYQRA
jgi:glyoxylase-like metal-dependent hydrolase (beta-lactamase superfamily II)